MSPAHALAAAREAALDYHYRPDPTAEGCDDCGGDYRGHAQRWTPSASWHAYIAPGRDLIAMRVRARLYRRRTGTELYDFPLVRCAVEAAAATTQEA